MFCALWIPIDVEADQRSLESKPVANSASRGEGRERCLLSDRKLFCRVGDLFLERHHGTTSPSPTQTMPEDYVSSGNTAPVCVGHFLVGDERIF
jgi:hypothetical protein